jgi:hypothetical protein
MRLYLLTQIDASGWDEYNAKLIRANTQKEAREVANARAGDEGQIWGDKSKVSTEIIKYNGEVEEIIGDFNAG